MEITILEILGRDNNFVLLTKTHELLLNYFFYILGHTGSVKGSLQL